MTTYIAQQARIYPKPGHIMTTTRISVETAKNMAQSAISMIESATCAEMIKRDIGIDVDVCSVSREFEFGEGIYLCYCYTNRVVYLQTIIKAECV